MEQEQYDEEVKVVLLPNKQEVTSEDLTTMPDVVRERVRHFVSMLLGKHLMIKVFYPSGNLLFKEAMGN